MLEVIGLCLLIVFEMIYCWPILLLLYGFVWPVNLLLTLLSVIVWNSSVLIWVVNW